MEAERLNIKSNSIIFHETIADLQSIGQGFQVKDMLTQQGTSNIQLLNYYLECEWYVVLDNKKYLITLYRHRNDKMQFQWEIRNNEEKRLAYRWYKIQACDVAYTGLLYNSLLDLKENFKKDTGIEIPVNILKALLESVIEHLWNK